MISHENNSVIDNGPLNHCTDTNNQQSIIHEVFEEGT